MRFSCRRTEFQGIHPVFLRALIRERRDAIREHRDARGDDRCWLDDWPVWLMLDDTPDEPTRLPSEKEAMTVCEFFYQWRREDEPDPMTPDAVPDPALWDSDLSAMSQSRLVDELERIQLAIRDHRDGALTAEDDRRLYTVLPERMPADFRLPPRDEFLGEAKAPNAGCPAFWRSHQRCPTKEHNFHRWGPCPAKRSV